MFVVFASVFLCLVTVSCSVPLACEDQLQPLKQLDPQHVKGRWALVAGSLKDRRAEDAMKGRPSLTIDYYNSSYTESSLVGGLCRYYRKNVSIDGPEVKLSVSRFNLTANFYKTSCSDCLLFTLDMESHNYTSRNLYLFSRNREVTPEVMDNFNAQVVCLNLPPPVVMDPNKELCPEQTDSK